MNGDYQLLYLLGGGLFVAGLGFLVVATSGDFLPAAIAWLVAAGVVALMMQTVLGEARLGRVLFASIVVTACPLLTFEGGLFVLPSALALLAAELLRTARPNNSSRARFPGSADES